MAAFNRKFLFLINRLFRELQDNLLVIKRSLYNLDNEKVCYVTGLTIEIKTNLKFFLPSCYITRDRGRSHSFRVM